MKAGSVMGIVIYPVSEGVLRACSVNALNPFITPISTSEIGEERGQKSHLRLEVRG
jgi:hypothetical protein